MNTGTLPVHTIDVDRIPELLPLSREPGWNQVAADWRLIIEHGDSFGLSTKAGRLVASGLTVMFDGAFGWTGCRLLRRADHPPPRTAGGGGSRPRIRSDAFSPIMMVGALVLHDGIRGMTEASATRNASMPRTFRSGCTTAMSSIPIRQVPTGW